MSNQATSTGKNLAGLWGRAISTVLRRSTVFYTLLLALFLSGTVPQGFMRAADGGGIAMVLCTTDGATEVWLSADGEILDEAPSDHSSSEMADCLAVSLSLAMVQSWFSALVHVAEFAPYHATFIDRRRALVAALTPLQPRAPPIPV